MGKKNKKWKPFALPVDDVPVQENITMEVEEVRQMLNGAHELVEKTVAKLYGSANLASHPFFFIHVNSYVLVATKAFYPCEIAVLKFSLQKGIEETYHSLINPGNLPLGFAHDAQMYSDVTHRVPYPPVKNAESNLAKIYDEVQQFVWGGPKAVEEQRRNSQFAEEDLCLPPMYTFYDKELFHYDFVNEAVVFDLMQKLMFSSDMSCHFVIHPLAKLFYELQKMGVLHDGVEDSKWASLQCAQEILEKDSFLYKPMLGCQFHEQIDAPACCSLSLVKRWALTVSSHCSASFQVPRLMAYRRDKREVSQEASMNSGTDKQLGQAAAAAKTPSCQGVPSRCQFPSRELPKLRQPYASIQGKKPAL